MPLLKKVMDLNGAAVVVLPKQWINVLEKMHGIKLKQILMEVGEEIRIRPCIPPKEEEIVEPEEVF